MATDPHEPSDRRELMSLREAADYCHVDYDTLYRWVEKGVLQALMVGPYNLIRVYRRDVEALVRPR